MAGILDVRAGGAWRVSNGSALGLGSEAVKGVVEKGRGRHGRRRRGRCLCFVAAWRRRAASGGSVGKRRGGGGVGRLGKKQQGRLTGGARL